MQRFPGQQLRLALVSYSRCSVMRSLTWASLRRFQAIHQDKYALELQAEPLLDHRDYPDSWNKLAVIRRTLLMGDFDAVVWIDPDVVITEPDLDPIYTAIVEELLPQDKRHAMLSGGSGSAPGSAVLIMKRGFGSLKLIEELLRSRPSRAVRDRFMSTNDMSDVMYPDCENDGEDLFDATVADRLDDFVMIPHGILQSPIWLVAGKETGCRSIGGTWKPGDFAAHVHRSASFLPDERVEVTRMFLRGLRLLRHRTGFNASSSS
eukprot:TRINITY_DN23635_c0_g1_i3.p1 TRINITY_DN23635_c0_g1~~TRINITY_DN23635_c0_g1_i3.p1  ORF type:complete len:263 (+),score=37.80 TRINITY_DN23635_c0_g1_i3:90-878(+)